MNITQEKPTLFSVSYFWDCRNSPRLKWETGGQRPEPACFTQWTSRNQTTRLAMGLWTSHPKAKELEIQSCSWINSWPLSLIGDESKPQRHTQLYLWMWLPTKSPVAPFLSSRQWQCFGLFFFSPALKAAKSREADFFRLWRTNNLLCLLHSFAK